MTKKISEKLFLRLSVKFSCVPYFNRQPANNPIIIKIYHLPTIVVTIVLFRYLYIPPVFL